MPIPALDLRGLLPVGTHDCTWEEIQERFCWNAHRTAVFERMQDFMQQRWRTLNISAPMYVDGSFTRSKQLPEDIDLVADVWHVPNDQILPVYLLHFDRDAIKADYKVDFWFKHPTYPTDLTAFFCYTGIKAAAELGVDAKHPKGILRVTP